MSPEDPRDTQEATLDACAWVQREGLGRSTVNSGAGGKEAVAGATGEEELVRERVEGEEKRRSPTCGGWVAAAASGVGDPGKAESQKGP